MAGRSSHSGENAGGNYVVTAQRPTAIKSSCVGSFSSPEHTNLIISKVTRIEIHRLTDNALEGMLDVPIYGRVASMELFRPAGKDHDLLFLLTAKLKFCILEYNLEKDHLNTVLLGDATTRVGRPTEWGVKGVIDSQARVLVISAYDGLLKIIPLTGDGGSKPQDVWDTRIDELAVVDINFLHGTPRPTLAVLYEDPENERRLKTYEVPVNTTGDKDKILVEGKINRSNLGVKPNRLIPIPAPIGGVIVVSQTEIHYISLETQKTVDLNDKVITAHNLVDPDGTRILLGDQLGGLYLLVLSYDGQNVLGLKLQQLGQTTIPSTIAYLDNGVVFVGSTMGDSQQIRLHPQPVDPADPLNFVEVLDTFNNLGPIVQFTAMDLERQGQVQVVTCSGGGQNGSLRVIRSGIGMVGQSSVELEGIRGMWDLRRSFDDEYDSMLVLSFIAESRVLGMDEDQLGELEPGGLDTDIQTLFCGNMLGDHIVQITAKEVRLLSSECQFVGDWKPPAGSNINVATGNASQIILVSGRGNLVLLELQGDKLVERGVQHYDIDIACLDITPLNHSDPAAKFAAMGMWDDTVRILSLPDLSLVFQDKIEGNVVPRNVLFATLGPANKSYLLLAMGDGKLINYGVDVETGKLADRKSISLGTRPINLRMFISNGVRYVFAASDRPTIVHSSNHKLLYSNLNEDEVNFMSSFNTSSFPGHLALAKDDVLTIGRIDEVQKLHVRTVPLGEQPFRICHCPSARALVVVTMLGPDGIKGFKLNLLDESTFEVKDSFTLQSQEWGVSLSQVVFSGDPAVYIVLGTALVDPAEEDVKNGRVLLFNIVEARLVLVTEKAMFGSVYCSAPFEGMLLCGINSTLQLFDLRNNAQGAKELHAITTYNRGQILTLYMSVKGNHVLLGDVMRSVSLLRYNSEMQCFELEARDQKSSWMLAIEMFSEDFYIGAENNYNLFTVSWQPDSLHDYDRSRLKEVGLFHLGDQVNQFQKGSLVMQNNDNPAFREIQTIIFGTITGSIGVVASLPAEIYAQIADVEASMRSVVEGVGGLDHSQWRAFQDESSFQPYPARGFVDGDLVEQFLELGKEAMQKVVGGMKKPSTIEDVSRLVEELSRAIH